MRGTTTLLEGPSGGGKTYALTTLIEAGLELAVVVTEPGGHESLIDAVEARGLDRSKLHWRYVAPVSPDWSTLTDMSNKISLMSYEDLTKIKAGIGKQDFNQFGELLDVLSDFTCEQCGAHIGPIDDLDDTWGFSLDSLSGMNVMAMKQMIGAKPAAHQGEWGVAMNAEETLIMKLTSDLDCFFVLTAHVEREFSELQGTQQIMTSALGRKLAPKLPRLFSDVILAYREGSDFYWSTSAPDVDLKTRTLPLASKLEPSFVPIVRRHRERATLYEQT